MSENQNLTPEEKPEVEVGPKVNDVAVAAAATGNKILAVSILIAALLICGTLIYVFGPSNSGNSNTTTSTVGAVSTTTSVMPNFAKTLPYPQTKVGNDVVLGNPNAPVQLIEYGDYQCTFCNLYFAQTEPQIRAQYLASGQVSEVFRNLVVIDNFVQGGHESEDAALAASCAMDQNEFWQYHDALYDFKNANPGENIGDITQSLLTTIASDLGMNVSEFTSCYTSQKYASLIASQIKQASTLFPQQATPSFTINGTVLQGAEPFSVFQTAISAALTKAGK